MERETDLGGWLPSRAIAFEEGGVEEIWCGVSVRSIDGNFIRAETRDLLFAAVEDYLAPVEFEARGDWPTGDVGWFEAVRPGLG